MKIKELGKGAKFMRKNENESDCFVKVQYEAINAVCIQDGEIYSLNPEEDVRLVII